MMEKALRDKGYLLPAIMAAIAFVVPMVTPATESNPAAHAGSFGAMAAFCTSLILVFEALNGESLKFRRAPSVLIGIGGLFSAYLWMAAEANSHPTDPSLSLPLVLLFVMAILWFVLLFAIGAAEDN